MRITKKKKMQMVVPPKKFIDYEWDEDFKLMMFCLEFTRVSMGGEHDDIVKEWGYEDSQEVYDRLWCGYKYYKGDAFDKKFSVFKSHITCSRCKNDIQMAEIKPISLRDKYLGSEWKKVT